MEAAPPSPSPPKPSPPSSPAPDFPKHSSVLRYKLAWRFFMIANFALGAYIFTKPKPKGVTDKKPPAEVPPPSPPEPQNQSISESDCPLFDGEIDIVPSSPFDKPLKQRDPIHENEQREIFNFVLEEWRQKKPKDREEKRRIDNEKAIIKKFVRAESIPEF